MDCVYKNHKISIINDFLTIERTKEIIYILELVFFIYIISSFVLYYL